MHGIHTHRLIVACWLVFLLYWFVSALKVKRTAERIRPRVRLSYRLPTSLGALLLFWVNWLPPWNRMLLPRMGPLAAGLCVLGLIIAIWARHTLAANWSGDVTLKESHELIVRGPYQYVRHPIYTGLLTMVLATALSEGNLGAYCGALLIFAGTRVKMKIEEDLMLRHFPETYPGYQKRVKALIPFVI